MTHARSDLLVTFHVYVQMNMLLTVYLSVCSSAHMQTLTPMNQVIARGYIDSPGIFQIDTILWSQLGQLAFHRYQPLSTYKLQTFHTSHLKLPGNSAPWIIYCFLIKIILYRLYMIHASMIIYLCIMCCLLSFSFFSRVWSVVFLLVTLVRRFSQLNQCAGVTQKTASHQSGIGLTVLVLSSSHKSTMSSKDNTPRFEVI